MSDRLRKEPDPAWERFAAAEPWFAVLTQPKYLRANVRGTVENEFFETGTQYVDQVFDVLAGHVDAKFVPASVLEFGCGPGRLAIPFARRVPRVTAVDVSPAMLAIARDNAKRRGVSNIDFLSVTEFLAGDTKYDIVNCHLVLQRLTKREATELLRVLTERVAPGGVGVFHFPYRSRSRRVVSATRWVREHVPGVNAAANLLRRKSVAIPFVATHVFELHDALEIIDAGGLVYSHAISTRHGDADHVTLYAQKRETPAAAPKPVVMEDKTPVEEEDFIDVRKLIAETSVEELNRKAELYFSSLDNWEPHMAKPFAKVTDSGPILINLGVLLQGLRFWPGQTILDFGGGTGWLSRFLTQLGAKSIVLDVSPTALDIAREMYKRMPVIGDQPAPEFLPYDGHHIDLPDESVDRIVCFDAFHHAVDPGAVLKEFGRILKPGGLAAFAEPGPKHSRTAQSQFEMRTYQVVENDVDIHQIWRDAQEAGFVDLKLAAFNIPQFHVRLEQYDDLLAGGDTYTRWAELTRAHLGNVRNFFLTKGGVAVTDSREAEGLAATIEAEVDRAEARPHIEVTVTNTGRARWLPSDEKIGGVSIGAHLLDGDGNLINFNYHWQPIPKALQPGEKITFSFDIPPLGPGRYRLELDCVANQISWFSQVGSKPALVELDIS